MSNTMGEKLAYWAGFIDGEGSISITRNIVKKRSDNPEVRHNPSYYLRLTVYNTNKDILTDMQKFFGCGKVTMQTIQTTTHKAVWYWNTTTRQAYQVLKRIQPFLKLKKPQAELGIYFCETKKNHQHGWRGLSITEAKFREDCYRKMVELNGSARQWS